MLRLIAEKTLRKQHKFFYNCFIDFRKAFDTVSHDVCWADLRSYGTEEKIINILSHIYENSKAAVRFGKDIGDWINQEMGTKQGDPIPVIKNDDKFLYLGRLMTWNNDVSKEMNRGIGKAQGVTAGYNIVWKSTDTGIGTKLKILQTCVFSVLLYTCETWTLKKNDTRRLLASDMRYYRRLLNVKWHQKVPNEEVRNKVKTGNNVVQQVIRRELGLFGHVCRMKDVRLVKSIPDS